MSEEGAQGLDLERYAEIAHEIAKLCAGGV